MKIRLADKWDIEDIIELLKHYQSETPWKRLNKCSDADYVKNIMYHIISGSGVIFLAEKETDIVGLIIGVKNVSVWDPTLITMNEMAFWVEPEHRGTSAGYKLIKSYVDYCSNLKEKNLIEAFTISKMINSPELKYDRFGFNKLEETWLQ